MFVPLGQVTPMMSAKNLAKFQAYLDGFGQMRARTAAALPMLQQMQRDFGGLLRHDAAERRHSSARSPPASPTTSRW